MDEPLHARELVGERSVGLDDRPSHDTEVVVSDPSPHCFQLKTSETMLATKAACPLAKTSPPSGSIGIGGGAFLKPSLVGHLREPPEDRAHSVIGPRNLPDTGR